jgi:hypothetical protein
MSATPFSQSNADFTHQAHEAASRSLYPQFFTTLFGSSRVDRIDIQLRSRVDGPLDLKHGIDLTAEVECGFRDPIELNIQERFRRPKYANYQDLTITEHNFCSDQPSELMKIKADWFVYGYYDNGSDSFIEALAVNVTDLKEEIAADRLPWDNSKRNPKGQSFVSIDFEALYDSDVDFLRYEKGKQGDTA